MNWGGASVMLGLISLALIHPPWSLLLLLVLFPQFWRLVLGDAIEKDQAKPLPPAVARPAVRPPAPPRSAQQAGLSFSADPVRQPALAAPTAAQPVPTSAPQSQGAPGDHFTRHAMTPGWLYVASKEFHQEDLFKVGYTTLDPSHRIRSLNVQARGVTAAVGRFTLVHARRVPSSQLAEQRVFELLDRYRVSTYREFFKAPLAVIVDAIESVAAGMEAAEEWVFDDAAVALWASCPECGRALQFEAQPYDKGIQLACQPCGASWTEAIPRQH